MDASSRSSLSALSAACFLRAPALVSRARRRGLRFDLLKHHQEILFLAVAVPERPHFQAHRGGLALMLELHAVFVDDDAFSPGFVNGRAQIHHQLGAHHFQQMKAGLARGGRQVRAGVSLKMHNMEIRIDDERGRRVVLQQNRFRFLAEIDERAGRGNASAARRPAPEDGPRLRGTREKPPPPACAGRSDASGRPP